MGLVHVPSATLPIQPPANGLGKTADDGPSTWVPATHMGDSEETLGIDLAQSQPLYPYGE